MVGLWKLIRKVWGTFKVKTRFEEDNGRIVKFWHDVWCNDMPLKTLFLLYSLLLLLRRQKEQWSLGTLAFRETFMIGNWML